MAALKVIAMLFTDSGIKDKIVHVAECGRIQHLSQKQTGGETRSCPWSLTSKTRSTTPHRNAAGAFNKGAADSDVSERDRYGGIQLQMASKWPASAFCLSTQCIQLSDRALCAFAEVLKWHAIHARLRVKNAHKTMQHMMAIFGQSCIDRGFSSVGRAFA